MTTKLHFIGMTGAGAQAEHAPFFPSSDALKDWLHAYAADAYSRENNGASFDEAYDVETPEDRWRAAVEWAVGTGREEWYMGSKSFASVGPKGEPLDPLMEDFVAFDEEYLATLRSPAPTV